MRIYEVIEKEELGKTLTWPSSLAWRDKGGLRRPERSIYHRGKYRELLTM